MTSNSIQSASTRPMSVFSFDNHFRALRRRRPKSTPLPTRGQPSMSRSSDVIPRLMRATDRPASTVSRSGASNSQLVNHTQCRRVDQLEHEPTRRHNLVNHFKVKRSKSAQGKECSENSLIEVQVSRGYIQSRSKLNTQVTIKDEFFELAPSSKEASREKISSIPERDALIEQLMQQISDLSLYLEEERLNHKLTKQKAEEALKDKVRQLTSQFQEESRELLDQHQEEQHKGKLALEARHKEIQDTMEIQIRRLTKDLEFTQSAFEVYRSTLNTESAQKWKSKEEELKHKFEEEKQQVIHETKTKLMQDWNLEKAKLVREQHRAVETLRKEHKRDLESLVNRFSSAAADVEKLRRVEEELKETKADFQELQERYETAFQQLTSVISKLTHAESRLSEFEKHFDVQVMQVDERYRMKIQELTTQNMELKRMFAKKCGELFEEKVSSDYKRAERVRSAKGALETLGRSHQPISSNKLLSDGRFKKKHSDD